MHGLVGMSFLEVADRRPVYLIGDDVLVAESDSPVRWHRIGSLSAHAQALLDWTARNLIDDPDRPAMNRAWNPAELAFCARDLVPYLMYLESRDDTVLQCPGEVVQRLDSFAERLHSVHQSTSVRSRARFTVDELAAWFRTPCMLGNRLAVPLEPMRADWAFAIPVAEVRGTTYMQQPDRRPLHQAEYVAHVRNVARRVLKMRAGGPDHRVISAAELERGYEDVLSFYHPRSEGAYSVVYSGVGHQLQYRNGRFVLVRGPESYVPGLPKDPRARFYVGLRIKGQTRREWLANKPQRAPGAAAFLSTAGTSTVGAMCIGNRQQYAHLLEDRWTDAEAVVLFLDAAARIASGRTTRRAHSQTVAARSRRPLPSKPLSRPRVSAVPPALHVGSTSTLTMDWLAWEKCLAVADVLTRGFGAPDLEYALLGATDEKQPERVTTMILLPGQEVASDAVEVSGHQVLAAASEFRQLGKSQGARLIPIVFVHRHLGGCAMSTTDVEFLNSVFVEHVAAVHPNPQSVAHDAIGCGCSRQSCLVRSPTGAPTLTQRGARVNSVVAFSLIVNGSGESAIHGAKKLWCRSCGRSRVEAAPVQLALVGDRSPTTAERAALRRQLEQEVSERIRLPDANERRRQVR